MYHSLKFHSHSCQVKFPEYLSQHDLIFESPARHWTSGLALGNGDMGALHFVPEAPAHIEWLINKNDLWDLRHPANTNRKHYMPHREIIERIQRGEPIDRKNLKEAVFLGRGRTTLKSGGRLRFGPFSERAADHTSYTHFPNRRKDLSCSQRLCLSDGVAVTKLGSCTIRSFVHATMNVLVVQVQFGYNSFPLPIEIQRWTDNTLGYAPDVYADGVHFGIGYHFLGEESVWPQPYPELQRGIQYVMLGRISGMNYQTSKFPERAIADFAAKHLRGGRPEFHPLKDYTLFVALATNRQASDPLEEAKNILDKAVSVGYEALYESHQQWWRNFWTQSWIDIPDKPLENLWYYGLYQLASCSRSEPHTGIAGLWHGPDLWPGHHDGVSYQGAYTNDINTVAPHYWTLATNHVELLKSYIETFSKIQPVAEELTKEMFGLKGMHMPGTTYPSGMESTSFPGRYNFVSTPLVGMLYWMAWDYLHDEKLLRERVYPFLRSGSQFFVQYMNEKDKNGRYQLWPCYPSEDSRYLPYCVEHNPTGTLMMIKAMLQKTLEFARKLNEDQELQIQIQELLKHYPEYPIGGGYFLQSLDEPDPHFGKGISRTEAGFPNAEITLDDPPEKVALLRNTLQIFRHNEFWANVGTYSWENFYTGGSLARLQMADDLIKYIYGHVLPVYLKPNGFLSDMPIRDGRTRHSQEPLLEGICGLGNCITEMLLQSYRGVIRVFPCWPEAWRYQSASFCDLRAEGAFLVSASRKTGSIQEIGIFSEKGERCRLLNPWEGLKATVIKCENSEVILKSSERELAFDTVADKSYFAVGPEGISSRVKELVLTTHHKNKTSSQVVLEMRTAQAASQPRIIECLEGSRVCLGQPDLYTFWEKYSCRSS